MKSCTVNQMRNIHIAYAVLEQICLEAKGECENCPLYNNATLTRSDGTVYHFDCVLKKMGEVRDDLADYIEYQREKLIAEVIK